MCGIAGIYRFSRNGADDERIVAAMLERLVHRGPDDSGIEHRDGFTAGSRRLAIVDLTSAGHQPMWSGDGRYLITYNGEIYNYEELYKDLGVDRKTLRSQTDTEVILLAWAKWGMGALDRFVGQWAFSVYDTRERRMWLARDRFGEKPLFYHHGTAALSFASSIPALFQAPWVQRRLDADALLEYLTLRYVVAPRTIIRGVEKLPGGHLLEVTPEGVGVKRWYRPNFGGRHAPRRSRSALVEEFDSLFQQAVRRCLISDVPVALLLSDGIDSKSIKASLQEQGRGVPSFTYTLAQEETGLREPRAGEDDITQLFVTPSDRLQQMVPALASLTEPVGDGAILATWLLIKHARPKATVFLCGHGGDEVLGGYRLSQDRFRLSVVRRLAGLPQSVIGGPIDRWIYGSESVKERQRAVYETAAQNTPAVARYLTHRPLPIRDLAELLGLPQLPSNQYLSTVDTLYNECLETDTDLDRMQSVMLATFLSANILSFADSVAMDSSAELRMPYLDRDLVNFVVSLHSSARVSRWPGRANTKLILRWWGEQHLSREVVREPKHTFPFGNLPELILTNRDEIRGRILGSVAVGNALPGISQWLDHPPEYYRGPWEGTLWALLSLGIWCNDAGVT